MMPPRAAWKLACALAGMDLNGKLDAVAEPWEGMARHLAGLPPPDRAAAFQAMLTARPDRDELVKDVADQRPDEPPPEDDGDALEEWEPIRLGTLPPVEPFPLDVLPCPTRDLATAAAESIGCPIDFPAVAILAAASGLIGRSTSLLIKPGYFESASLYMAIVGTPSTGKSPALRAALAPVWSVASMLDQASRTEMDAWNEAAPKDRGEKPTPRRIVIDRSHDRGPWPDPGQEPPGFDRGPGRDDEMGHVDGSVQGWQGRGPPVLPVRVERGSRLHRPRQEHERTDRGSASVPDCCRRDDARHADRAARGEGPR